MAKKTCDGQCVVPSPRATNIIWWHLTMILWFHLGCVGLTMPSSDEDEGIVSPTGPCPSKMAWNKLMGCLRNGILVACHKMHKMVCLAYNLSIPFLQKTFSKCNNSCFAVMSKNRHSHLTNVDALRENEVPRDPPSVKSSQTGEHNWPAGISFQGMFDLHHYYIVLQAFSDIVEPKRS